MSARRAREAVRRRLRFERIFSRPIWTGARECIRNDRRSRSSSIAHDLSFALREAQLREAAFQRLRALRGQR